MVGNKTVFENQLNAMGELAKFDITGDLRHLEVAHYLAYQSGMDGDEKTTMLNEPRLSEWYNEGLYDRVTDHAIGEMEHTDKMSRITVKALPGQTYIGKIIDAGNRYNVDQAVVKEGVEVVVRHDVKRLMSTHSGLINIGNTVVVFYPVPEMGLVEQASETGTA
ncbi:hypothetical protein [Pseudomonas sp. PS02290]|uniref:hypothetical protein n=1 Tax=Pseudomonas sp. PS02290 TaxID=2991430 RepID=UPI00249CCD34|nr:hypothetical protein [Pseudomonas sp. PS02290]